MELNLPLGRTQELISSTEATQSNIEQGLSLFFTPEESVSFRKTVFSIAYKYQIPNSNDFLRDVLAEIFIALHSNKFDPNKFDKPITVIMYAVGIAKNMARKFATEAAKESKRNTVLDEEIKDPNEDLALTVHKRLLTEAIKLAIMKMAPIYQQVLKYSFDGLNDGEIAEIVGESPQCIRKRRSRAMAQLLKKLNGSIST